LRLILLDIVISCT